MKLLDKQNDGSFGSFFGHPNGEKESKGYVRRMLKEFDLKFEDFDKLILSASVPSGAKVTSLQDPLSTIFSNAGWLKQPNYPESPAGYKADLGYVRDNRYILVEIELSDIRRSVSSLFMSRVFRTGFMRLGILIAPESSRPEKNKRFYSSLKARYSYLAPDYPLWVIGFEFP